MDKQILDLLTEMNAEMKSVKTDLQSFKSAMKTDIHSLNTEMKSTKTEVQSLKSEMNSKFDAIEAKLKGAGEHLELTSESRINEMGFLTEKVHKIEKELNILKNQ